MARAVSYAAFALLSSAFETMLSGRLLFRFHSLSALSNSAWASWSLTPRLDRAKPLLLMYIRVWPSLTLRPGRSAPSERRAAPAERAMTEVPAP